MPDDFPKPKSVTTVSELITLLKFLRHEYGDTERLHCQVVGDGPDGGAWMMGLTIAAVPKSDPVMIVLSLSHPALKVLPPGAWDNVDAPTVPQMPVLPSLLTDSPTELARIADLVGMEPEPEPEPKILKPQWPCEACNAIGRVHEDRTDRDKSAYRQIQPMDPTEGLRLVPCRRCKGLQREPGGNEIILTTAEFEALPEHSAAMSAPVVLGQRWKCDRSARFSPLLPPGKLPGGRPQPSWWRGEYGDTDGPDNVGIDWKRITVHDDPLKIGDVCPKCDGSGSVGVGAGGNRIGVHFEQCFDCNGSGQVRESMAARLAALRADQQPGPEPGDDDDGSDDEAE